MENLTLIRLLHRILDFELLNVLDFLLDTMSGMSDEEYEVEKILDKRVDKFGYTEYLGKLVTPYSLSSY